MGRVRLRFSIRGLMVLVVVAGLGSAFFAHVVRLRTRAAAVNVQHAKILKAQADYQNARLTREVAEIALVEYEKAIFPQDLETARGELAVAQADRKRAEDRAAWADRIERKGLLLFINPPSTKLDLQRAIFAEEQAQTKKNVLEKFTYDKTIKELRSEAEKARSDELAKKATIDRERAVLKRMTGG